MASASEALAVASAALCVYTCDSEARAGTSSIEAAGYVGYANGYDPADCGVLPRGDIGYMEASAQAMAEPVPVATKGGSALAAASNAAFRAADAVGEWTVSAKHLPGAGGRWSKWA